MKQTVKILFTSLKMRKAKMDQGCSGDQFTEFLMNWILTLSSWFPAFFGGKVTPVSTEQNLIANTVTTLLRKLSPQVRFF